MKTLCVPLGLGTFLTLATGCATPYLTAAGDFGAVTSATTSQLQSLPQISLTLCRRQAFGDFLLDRFVTSKKDKDGVAIVWPRFMDAPTPTLSGGTWTDECKAIATSYKVFSDALSVLGGYGSALQKIATGSYAGKDLSGVLKDANTALGNLKTAPPKTVTDVLTNIQGPLQAIADLVEKEATESKLKEAVTQANPSVKTIIDSLLGFLDAAAFQALDVNNKIANLAKEVDSTLTPTRKDGEKYVAVSPEFIPVYEAIEGMASSQQAVQSQIDAMKKSLASLQSASAKLAEAGGKDEKSDEFKNLIKNIAGLVEDAYGNAQSAQGASNQKGGT
jgi:hypothetical protein